MGPSRLLFLSEACLGHPSTRGGLGMLWLQPVTGQDSLYALQSLKQT